MSISKNSCLFLMLLFSLCTAAQQSAHPQSSQYQWPTEPAVKAKLEQWQDQKFGIIIHWGLYAVPGIVESWTLCSEDWINRDRTVHGPYENYQTPEQRVPETQLSDPWESCMTLGGAWGYVPGDKPKSATTVIHTLIEVVAKGGSLLLGIGPKPDGTLTDESVQRLKEVGQWLHKNGEAIYNTRITPDYHQGNIWFTQNTRSKMHYALVCLKEGEQMPAEIVWQNNTPKKGSKIKLLQNGENVKWKMDGDKVKISLPANVLKNALPALAFAFIAE